MNTKEAASAKLYKMVFLSLIRVQRLPQTFSSKEIRTTFINYFEKQHDHKFIRSSPVLPLCDPGLAFVNAGMNQVSKFVTPTITKPILYTFVLYFFSLNQFSWVLQNHLIAVQQIIKNVYELAANTTI